MDRAAITVRADAFDAAYRRAGAHPPSWTELDPTTSIGLIGRLGVDLDCAVADVGGGDGTLAWHLLALGHTDVLVVDLSEAALALAAARLGADPRVTLVCAEATAWTAPRPLGCWHDRACLHFLTADADRRAYFERLRASVAPRGAVVLGCFALTGPSHCSGLEVRRSDAEGLAAELGGGFEVVESLEATHVTPSGAAQRFAWLAARAP